MSHSSLGVKYVWVNDVQAGRCHLRVEKQLMLRWSEAATVMKSTSLWWPAMDSPVQDHLSTTLFLQCNPLPFICKSTPTRPLKYPSTTLLHVQAFSAAAEWLCSKHCYQGCHAL